MESVLSPVMISIKIALLATAFSFIIGTVLAYLLSRKTNIFTTIIETIILLPMIMPPTITGYILLLALSRDSIITQITGGNSLIFTWWAGVIASTLVAIPLMYQNAKGGFLSVSGRYEDIGKTLGLTRGRIIFNIDLPLILPALISGMILAFARALGEFGATLMVAGSIPGKTRTIASAIFFAIESGDLKTANILLVIMVIISFSLIFILNYILKRKKIK